MRAVALAGLMLLAGCQNSFDERYADAQKKLNEQAASIDQELAAKSSEAGMAAEPAGVSSPAPASSPAEPLRRIPGP